MPQVGPPAELPNDNAAPAHASLATPTTRPERASLALGICAMPPINKTRLAYLIDLIADAWRRATKRPLDLGTVQEEATALCLTIGIKNAPFSIEGDIAPVGEKNGLEFWRLNYPDTPQHVYAMTYERRYDQSPVGESIAKCDAGDVSHWRTAWMAALSISDIRIPTESSGGPTPAAAIEVKTASATEKVSRPHNGFASIADLVRVANVPTEQQSAVKKMLNRLRLKNCGDTSLWLEIADGGGCQPRFMLNSADPRVQGILARRRRAK